MTGGEQRGEVVLTHTFIGPRFDDHGLSVDVLEELVALKRLLVDTACELWRRNHPARQRLPGGFESAFDLKFYELTPGSTCLALRRPFLPQQAQLSIVEFPDHENGRDEYDEAAELLQACVIAVGAGGLLPEKMPKEMIPRFGQLGKTLQADESYLLVTTSDPTPAVFDINVRQKLAEWQPSDYEDRVFIEGEVHEADIDKRHFRLHTYDGERIDCSFTDDKKGMILEALSQHESRRLRMLARAKFDAMTRKLLRVIQVEDYYIVVPEEEFDERAVPIWITLQEIANSVPSTAWQDVPQDLAANFDRYSRSK